MKSIMWQSFRALRAAAVRSDMSCWMLNSSETAAQGMLDTGFMRLGTI